MKIIYLTDSHFDARTPASRSDNYFDTCMAKLTEILEFAKEHHINTILHGGDFFDSPKPGYSTLLPFMDVLARYPDIHWYINVGNHDLYGWNLDTYPRTALKVLSYLPNVTVLPDHMVCSIGNHIKIFSIWSMFNREGDPTIFELPELYRGDVNTYIIVMAHTMLVEKTFISAHIPMEKINLEQTGDLILGSHYHPGWRIRRVKHDNRETVFAHPAALLRIVKSDPQYIYQPAFIVIDIADDEPPTIINPCARLRGLELVPLKCAVPYPFREDAATIPERDVLLQSAPKYNAFMEELMSTSIEASALDPRVLAARIAHDQGFPENVLRRVITNLDVVKKEH